jgi:hypothetical protein
LNLQELAWFLTLSISLLIVIYINLEIHLGQEVMNEYKQNDDKKYFGLEPRTSNVSFPLPKDEELPAEVVSTLSELPKLNNLRMFARVCHDASIHL